MITRATAAAAAVAVAVAVAVVAVVAVTVVVVVIFETRPKAAPFLLASRYYSRFLLYGVAFLTSKLPQSCMR